MAECVAAAVDFACTREEAREVSDPECKLRKTNGMPGMLCDTDSCIYWRVAGHMGLDDDFEGCAIQHFEMLEGGERMAQWLLSVKQRVEGGEPS